MPIFTARSTESCYPGRGFDLEQALARPTRDNFSKNLRRIMADRGIRNATIAKEFGLSRATVGRWVDGEAQPGFDQLDRLARYLKVPVSRLFEDPTDPDSIGITPDKALQVLADALKSKT